MIGCNALQQHVVERGCAAAAQAGLTLQVISEGSCGRGASGHGSLALPDSLRSNPCITGAFDRRRWIRTRKSLQAVCLLLLLLETLIDLANCCIVCGSRSANFSVEEPVGHTNTHRNSARRRLTLSASTVGRATAYVSLGVLGAGKGRGCW